MSKVIFLDIDGVLNKHRGSYTTREKSPMGFVGLDKKYIKFLKQLVEETNATVVLSSDWKACFTEANCNPETAKNEDGRYIYTRLKENGITLAERTDDRSVGDDFSTGRGYGIRKYLKAHPEVENYVILDDVEFHDFTGELKEHLVLCECPFGKRNYNKAIKILNKQV